MRPKSSMGRPSRWRRLLPPRRCRQPSWLPHRGHLAEIDEVLEVDLRQGRRIRNGVFRRDGAVGLNRDREPIVVRPLSHAGFCHREVCAANRIVDGVDANQVDRERTVGRVHLGFDVATTLVDVELHGHVAVILQRKEKMIGVLDHDRAMFLDIASVDRARTFTPDVQDRVINVFSDTRVRALRRWTI